MAARKGINTCGKEKINSLDAEDERVVRSAFSVAYFRTDFVSHDTN